MIEWTVQIKLISGEIELIGCETREDAEIVKQDWFKTKKYLIKCIHVILGNLVSKEPKEENEVAKAMILNMFRQ